MRQEVITAPTPAASRVARDAVVKIKTIHTRMVEDVVAIGRELLSVKEALGHGNFTPWLKESFDWTDRTAQRYMQVAEQFGSNPTRMSVLPMATVYKLASPSTPAAIRAEVVQRLEAGETVDPTDIAYRVSEATREARQNAQEERRIAARNPKLSKVQVRETREARQQRIADKLAQEQREREERQQAQAVAVRAFVQSLDEDRKSDLRRLCTHLNWHVTGSDFLRALTSDA